MWLHCNMCGILKSESNKEKFYVLLCTHVLCEKCNLSQICPIDKRPSKRDEINSSMSQKLRIYFEDPNKLLSSWQKCIRYQCEQRSLCEQQVRTTTTEQTRKLGEEINVLKKYKEVTINVIEKEMKSINKMKAYLRILAEKLRSEDLYESHSSRNTTITTSSTSALSLNASNNALGESGVDLEFDDLNRSN